MTDNLGTSIFSNPIQFTVYPYVTGNINITGTKISQGINQGSFSSGEIIQLNYNIYNGSKPYTIKDYVSCNSGSTTISGYNNTLIGNSTQFTLPTISQNQYVGLCSFSGTVTDSLGYRAYLNGAEAMFAAPQSTTIPSTSSNPSNQDNSGILLIAIVIIVVLLTGGYLVLRKRDNGSKGDERKPEVVMSNDEIKILKERYAKGEITEKHYKQMKTDLED